MFYRGSKQLLAVVLAVLLSLPIIAQTVQAQTAEATATTELPAQLTREAVDQFLGQLSDKEVRQALRNQLVAVADKQAAEASEQPTTVEFFGNAVSAVGKAAGRMQREERLLCYKKDACPRCEAPIESWELGARTMYACPTCQC